jgi:peptidoglycan/xylan/chitin deacetylase (PgdA/CDA1 family)
MTLKHTVVLLFAVGALIVIGGSAFDPAAQPAVNVKVAGAVLPSASLSIVPTSTHTPTATLTETPTSTPTTVPTATPSLPPTATRTRAPAPTANPAARAIRVPILMYHYISVPPPDADKYRLDLSVIPDAFETQMDYLAINGYHPIRLVDLADYLLNGTALPDKPIVLTFDDGYADNYANAFPILHNHKFAGTFFVITQFVNENRWGYMSWAQLEEMATAGMEIGSHSIDHPDLRSKSKAFQTQQLAGSKQMIETRLGVPVLSFAYPAGKYDANTISILRSGGYLSAVTEIQGTNQSSERVYELQRIRIRGSYTISDFEHWLKWFLENGK